MTTCDGDLLMSTSSGAPQGGSVAVHIFNECYWSTVHPFNVFVAELNPMMWRRSPLDPDVEVHLSSTVFVDDTAVRLAAEDVGTLFQDASACSLALSAAIGHAGMVRNVDKEERIVSFVGRGAQSSYRDVLADYGSYKLAARYLGPYIRYDVGSAGEIGRRIDAASKAWLDFKRV